MLFNRVISFSGLDGSGKTTLITRVQNRLEDEGYSVVMLTIYDHASFYAVIRRIRDYFLENNKKHKDEPIEKNIEVKRTKSYIYKIIRSKSLKRILFFLDIITLIFIKILYIGRKKVLLMDRYFYDSLLDVLNEDFNRRLLKIVVCLLPKPNLSVFVDVPGEVAFSRKFEFSVPYLNWRRVAYSEVFKSLEKKVIINNENDLDSNVNILLTRIQSIL